MFSKHAQTPFFLCFSSKIFCVQESLAFGLHRGGRVLLGDEMGLGKTLQVRRNFRLLQLRKFLGRKRCHDDEYEICYLYIYIYMYIHLYIYTLYTYR